MAKILLLNGPNLNMLGTREVSTYGANTLQDIVLKSTSKAFDYGFELIHFQSSSESQLIDAIHTNKNVDIIIINPAAYTHTSIAIRDAILAVDVPCIELHLSNIYKREEFRHHSFFSDIAIGVISGFGAVGYDLAIDAAADYLKNK